MDARLTSALQSPVDYSSGFSEQVRQIRDQISESLGMEAGMDTDTNYRAGQRIVLRFNERGEPVAWQDTSCMIELSVFVSSRGYYYTYLLRRLEQPSFDFVKLGLPHPKAVWNTVSLQTEVWVREVMSRIDSVMNRNSYVCLEGQVLSQIVADKYTDMDGKPASVFEVLFSEID